MFRYTRHFSPRHPGSRHAGHPFAHRFGGGFGHGGRGMRAARMLGSAELQLLILQLRREKPRHGYEIIKALEEHSSGIYAPSPAMVYPALTYLEEAGHAESSAEGNRKLFTITSQGAEHLEKNQTLATELWNQLMLWGRKVAQAQKQYADEEDLADHFGADRQGRPGREWRQMKAEFGVLREELRAALREKINASREEKQRILEVLRGAITAIRGK